MALEHQEEAFWEQNVPIFVSLCVGEIYVAMVSQLPAIRASS